MTLDEIENLDIDFCTMIGEAEDGTYTVFMRLPRWDTLEEAEKACLDLTELVNKHFGYAAKRWTS